VLTPTQEEGRQLFDHVNCGIPQTDACLAAGNCPPNTCSNCHTLNPHSNPQTTQPGFFGTAGHSSFGFNPQLFKIPHLRNIYQKVGMFGNPPSPAFLTNDTGHQGDQVREVRGFGLLHDGGMDTVFRFMHGISFAELFTGPGNQGLPTPPDGAAERRQIEAFVLAFPTNLAPIVGQQVTLSAATAAAVTPRIALLLARAEAGECELVAKGTTLTGRSVGFLYVGNGQFETDRDAIPLVTEEALRFLGTLPRHEITYTCTPLGSGRRIGIDRDADGFLDGDEAAASSNPADPTSTPGTP
jgi:hypothetical protein